MHKSANTPRQSWMKSPALRISCLLLFLVCAATSMFAQGSAGYGAVTGVVQDPTGAVVSGAKVVLDNPSKGIHREMESTSGGVYNFLNLVPADGYVLNVSKTGFNKFEVRDITVSVGGTVTVNPNLIIGGSATTVEVTGAAPMVDSTKSDVSSVVESKQIMDLPINGRRVDSFVLLTPGVTSDGPFGLISFRGNPGGNTFLTDGNDTTNQYYGENAGRTRTTNIGQDAVQEFQVVSSNFLAEYGRASGGVINTVTRSGSNDLHGTAFWFFRNRTLNATDPTSFGVNPPEHRHQFGGSLGGPIKKDKLFFFGNVELQRRDAPIVSSNLNNGLFLPTGAIDTTKQTCDTSGGPYVSGGKNYYRISATQTQCDAAIAYLQSRAKVQLVPRTMETNLAFAKIDYRPNDKHSFSFSGNYLDFRSPNGIQTQISLTDGNGIGGNGDTNVFNRTGRASWTWLVSNTMLNEMRFGYFKDRQYDPAAGSLLPSIGPVALSVNSVSNLGFAPNYPRLNPSEQRFQIADSFNWTTGKHTMKFGFDWAHVEDYVYQLRNQFGTYTYSNTSVAVGTAPNPIVTYNATALTNFALDFGGSAFAQCGGAGATYLLMNSACHFSRFEQAFGRKDVDITVSDFSFYGQDQWKLSSKLTITPGIRVEHNFLPSAIQPNPAVPATSRVPEAHWDVAPRFGIAYQVGPKATLRAGYGIFYNRYTTATLQNVFTVNGVYQGSYSLQPGSSGTGTAQMAAAPTFPNYLSSAPTAVAGTSNIFYLDPNFRNPYSQQANLGLEVEVAKNTSLTVSYVWSRGLHMLMTKDDNVVEPTADCSNPAALGAYNNNNCYNYAILDANNQQVGNYATAIYRSRINPALGALLNLQSAGNSYYNGLLVQLRQRYKWMTNNVSYTWAHSMDYNQGGTPTFGSQYPTSLVNGDYKDEKGNSSLDQRQRLVINTVFTPQFSKSTSWAAKWLVNGWQLSQVSSLGSSFSMVPVIGQSKISGALNSGLNGFGGSNRVPFMSLDDMKIGNIYKTDARVAKMLPISGERVKAYLMFEAFNVFNTVIPGGTGARNNQAYYMTSTQAGFNTWVIKPNASYGQLKQTQAPPDGTTARRAQVALRLTF